MNLLGNSLENLYEEAEETSKLLEEAHCTQDEYKKCGDALVYSMLPRSVADRLQNGEPAISTCQVYFLYYLPLRYVSFSPRFLRV